MQQRARAARRDQPAGRPRPGDDLPEVPGEGARAALRLGRGAGRRPGPLARRRADPGAAGTAPRAAGQVGQATEIGCGARRGRRSGGRRVCDHSWTQKRRGHSAKGRRPTGPSRNTRRPWTTEQRALDDAKQTSYYQTIALAAPEVMANNVPPRRPASWTLARRSFASGSGVR